MRALWFISTIFLLYGCGDIQTPSLQSTSSENKEVATFKLESIVEHRASRSFSLKWSGNTIPAWQKYTFCLNNAEKLNNCHVVKEGGNSANSTSLKLSVDISLEQLLMALKTPPFLLLYAEDKVVIDTYQLSIEQEQINKTIQYLKASNAKINKFFGSSVAISQNGKMLAIGARKENSASEDKSATDSIQDSGAVYIFSDSDENGWQETHFVKAEVIDIEDNFGANLALSHNGKTLAVAIPGDDATGTGVSANPSNNSENASDSGAVVVFELNDNNTWEQVAFLKASKVQADLGFGQALAISGDGLVLAVGGIFSDTVETFIKTNQGWRTFDTVKIAGASDSERFGHSLSLNTEGNVLAVSAPGVFGSDSSDIGKIYILTKGVDAFNSAKLIPTPAELTVKAQFGISIDLSADGTTLAAGSDAGAAYIFQLTSSSLRNENIWQLKHKITHSDKSAVKFGRSVSLNDDGSLISIYQESANLPAGISNQRPDGVANRFGALSVYRLGEKSVKLLYGLSPLKLAVYLEFGLVQMLSGDGKTLVASSASEGSNATGVNNEASHDRGDFSNSGAAWVFHL